MEYSDVFDDLDWKKPYKGLRDYHLSSALTSENLSLLSCGEFDKNLRKELAILSENFQITSRDPTQILGFILSNSPEVSTYHPSLFYAGRALKIESKVFESVEIPFLSKAGDLLQREPISFKYLNPCLFFQRCVVISNAMNAGKTLPENLELHPSDISIGFVTQELSIIGLTLKLGAECFGVMLGDQLLSIHDLNHLKNWSDKCTERWNIELSCHFGNKLNSHIYPSMTVIYTFWGLWDNYLETSGNMFYRCVKLFEALVIGVLLKKNSNDVITVSTDFLETTVQDFKLSNEETNPQLVEAVEKMRGFLMNIDSCQYLSQLYGMYRTWGHPIVNPTAGMNKVYELGTVRKQVSEIIPIQIRRIFMLRYCTWYKSTKGQYPEVVMSGGHEEDEEEDNIVLKNLKSNVSIRILETRLNSPFWDSIKFGKNVEIPKTYNLAEMVADKAVSPDRTSLFNMYEAGNIKYDANLRRGVLQWLTRNSESCESFLTRVSEQGLTVDESIIGLYQKEREVNETPRMFALMSHSIRNYIVTTEAMISNDLLSAFPHITMTNSLLSLQKRIYSISSLQANNSKRTGFKTYKDVTVIVNIDFEKWNLNFRKETTQGIFGAMGDLYGLPELFNKTYDIFNTSMIYLADGSYRPKINKKDKTFVLDPPNLYQGHLGGFEGLRQKGWTIFTDCVLDLICSRHKCSYNIMGQGDNQVLALTWRTYMLSGDRTISERGAARMTEAFLTFMSDMIDTFGLLGLPVKALETWSSEHLFLYGKVPTLRGVPLAMSLKKICRAYYLANEEIMTLECSLASVQSNAIAACMSDVSSFIPYIIYKIQILYAISSFYDYHVLLGEGAFNFNSNDSWHFTSSSGTKNQYKIGNTLSKWDFLTVLTWFPKILGGTSVASWYDFLMRGFPDRVSSSLTWLNHLKKIIKKKCLIDALDNIYQGHINPEQNFTLLIEDPCSLNLIVPVDARASLKQSVQELFENLYDVKNFEFLELFKFNRSWAKEEFYKSLCSGEVLHPRFLHDVGAATLGGYVDSIVSKVSKSSTINKLALRSSNKNPGQKIERHEKNYMAYLLWKTSPTNTHRSGIDLDCPTEQARTLRQTSWMKILEGVDVPFPLAYLKMETPNLLEERMLTSSTVKRGYISAILPESFSELTKDLVHKLGSCPPYLGSETREKLGADPNRQVFGREPLITRPLHLLRVINWFIKPGSNAEKVIYCLLQSVSDLEPKNYVSREMGITGSESHRYRDQALKHGVMSTNMYTLGSHMHVSTDTWSEYSKGSENFSINFQSVLCAIQALTGSIILQCLEESKIPNRTYRFYESCNQCIVPITDEFHDFPDDTPVKLIPSGKGNQYLWVSESSLTQKYKADPFLNLKIGEICFEEYLEIKNKREILTDWIAESISNDISSSETTESIVKLLDSREYPRVLYKKLSSSELWRKTAEILILRAGIKYTSADNKRICHLSSARDHAVIDLMRCSNSALMGLAMFYTWESKYKEMYLENESFVFPDTNPPSLNSACLAAKINLRDTIKTCNLFPQEELILSRENKQPLLTIKCFWYKSLCLTGTSCSMCIKSVSEINYEDENIINLALKCDLGHTVITGHMTNIKTLTASEDRLLKDCHSYECTLSSKTIKYNIPVCPAVIEWLDLCKLYSSKLCIDEHFLDPPIQQGESYTCLLPTMSKCRVYEMLSILIHKLGWEIPPNGVIWGDGLGESSRILSQIYSGTNWYSMSLQDSENSIPHSYPHTLVSCNPFPSTNINYTLSKSVYNDLTVDENIPTLSKMNLSGICWCEIEFSSGRNKGISNLLSISKWDIICIRTDFTSYDEMKDVIESIESNYDEVKCHITGSSNVSRYETLIFGRQPSNTSNLRESELTNNDKITIIANMYSSSCEELTVLSNSFIYSSYLHAIETKHELSMMLKRCDLWFSQVGINHLFECKRLFTPIWFDLQNGKIPESVKNLGSNKSKYLYQSEYLALQARLVSLAISMSKNNIKEEENSKGYWRLRITSGENCLNISLIRSDIKTYYGVDDETLIKFTYLLRRLNQSNRRLWHYIPRIVKFTTKLSENGFWISRSSLLVNKIQVMRI